MKIEIRPSLYLVDDASKPFSMVKGLHLLAAVEQEGNLQAASKVLAISYRHAWNMIGEMESLLGSPVIEMTRGRGSELTLLGKRLVRAEKLVHARLDPLLGSMATEIEAEIQSAISLGRNTLKIFASHGFAIEALNRQLQKKQIPLELSYRGSMEAVSAFSRGTCQIAGFHVPTGALEMPVFEQFAKLLQPEHRLINLANRRQGIIVAKGNPKKIWAVKDLLRPDVQFVNRQHGSGTRLILDLLLEKEGKSGRDINGFENVELTHAAVAAYISCGKADAGLGVETAARQFDLDFIPLLTERYFLVCETRMLSDTRFLPILEFLQTSEFRTEVSKLPGYDAGETGTAMSLPEAFPKADFGAGKTRSSPRNAKR